MRAELTDKLVNDMAPPPKGFVLVWDTYKRAPRGLALCVTKGGIRSFLLAYRATSGPSAGKERRLVIGRAGPHELDVAAARRIAKEMRRKIAAGLDPLAERAAAQDADAERRAAPDVAALCERYLKDYAEPSKRPRSVEQDRSLIAQHIKRALGDKKVREVTKADIEGLHHEITRKYETPVRANLTANLLSKMFALAVDWGLRPDNPASRIKRNPQQHRQRYLDPQGELRRLNAAIDKLCDSDGIDAIRLLLLTGARLSEVLKAEWSQFDLDRALWTKPASMTKQKRLHAVELSPQAVTVLRAMRHEANTGLRRAEALDKQAAETKNGEARAKLTEKAKLARLQHTSKFLFPSTKRLGQPIFSIRKLWLKILKEARISNFRLHDLRHSFASLVLAQGHSLPMVAHLLGHSQITTSSRYAHILPQRAREAAGDVGKLIASAGPKRRSAVTTRARR